ncbi:MAG TPA: ABC transporter permease [Rhodothermales bacterium]|nr:ABC transporter permease [Rhodothermales bacterium]
MNTHDDTSLWLRTANRLLAWFCASEVYEELRGDLEEQYQDRLERMSLRRARLGYVFDVLFLFRSFARRRTPAYHQARGPIMLKNYFKITMRNLRKQFGYTAINILGLAVGIACCLLIFMYVQHELSYDRHHEKAERIFRIGLDARIGDKDFLAPISPEPMREALVNDFPEVVAATRFFTFDDVVSVRHDDHSFLEKGFFYADSTVFDVFTFPLLRGDPATALTEPLAVVLTESTAQKYFGAANPIDETLLIDGQDYRVTGVMQDLPEASHLRFKFLASMGSTNATQNTFWISNNFYTYFVLPKGVDHKAFEAKLEELVQHYVGPAAQEALGMTVDEYRAAGGRYRYFIQPLTDIHLHSNLDYEIAPNSNAAYVYALSAIAVLILLIACINFMNLATARSAGRAREVGIRKTLGSNRGQLVRQFLLEATVMSLLALVVAILLVQVLLPLFNNIAGTSLTNVYVRDLRFLAGMVGLALLVGVLAGSYPAFFLAAFQPAKVLKGTSQRGSNALLRNGLVVFQFAISIALIVCTGVVFNQMNYMQQKNLGFEKEHVVVIERAWTLRDQREVFRQHVLRQPGVQQVSYSNNLPTRMVGDNAWRKEGAAANEVESLRVMYADAHLIQTLDMELAAGRNFAPDRAADSTAVILNEAAVALMGWEDPIGQHLIQPEVLADMEATRYTVIGVVKDFHYESLHEDIDPLAIQLSDFGQYWAVRIQPTDIPETVAALEAAWKQFVPEEPFE